jgi:hypothetical protein
VALHVTNHTKPIVSAKFTNIAMQLADILPFLGFLVLFPLWFRLVGHVIYRNSGWKNLAVHYRTDAARGRFSKIPRLVIGGTSINFCNVLKEADFVILRLGFPFRHLLPHPALKIPLSRIKMKGRNKGTISVQGNGIPFEGFDPRKLP